MPHQLLLDYELAVAREGYVVRALLKLEGHAPDTATKEVPLNLALVLDRSGSMAGEKLERAKEAAAFLVRRLRPTDTVAVVTYDDEVTTIAPADIAGIEPGGSTNLSGGWLRGHELVASARPHTSPATLHRLLLLTDGLANIGITDPQPLVGICRAAAAKGITTSTIGFGADYDEQLLRAMADAGGGNAWYIERPDQAPGVFEEEIEGLLTLAAQNVTVELHASEAVQLVAIHNRYPSRELADGVRLDLGDLYAREPKSLLMEFFVPGLAKREMIDIATVRVASWVLSADGAIERQEVTIPIAASLTEARSEHPEVQREVLLLAASRAREEALERRRRGDVGGAGQTLSAAASMLASSPLGAEPALAEQVDDLQSLAAKLSAGDFTAADAKYAAQRAYNAQRGKDEYERKLSRSRRQP